MGGTVARFVPPAYGNKSAIPMATSPEKGNFQSPPGITYPLNFGPLSVMCKAAGTPSSEAFGYRLPAGPIAVMHPFGNANFFRQGWQSWSYNDWRRVEDVPQTIYPNSAHIGVENQNCFKYPKMNGYGMGMFDAGHGKVLLVGSLGLGSFIDADQHQITGKFEGRNQEWYVGFGPEKDVQAAYTKLLRESLSPNPKIASPQKRISSLWCSWYSHYANISESQLLNDLHSVSDIKFDVFQIDDGWQKAVGDWEANPKFSSGMARMAEQIRLSGKTPGLWMAPFVAAHNSMTFKQHPNWFVRDDAGRPIRVQNNWGGYYALDLTHPEVKEFVKFTMRKASDWGYPYLKLDFLFAAAIQGHRFDDRIPREQVYREAVEMVRDTVGDDAYLLACGAPVYPSIGVFDGIRASCDTSPVWQIPPRETYWHDKVSPSGQNAFRNSFHRLWLNPLIQVDPDVVYFQSRNNVLTPRHKEITKQLAAVCGFKATSDVVANFSPGEKAALKNWAESQDQVTQLDRYRYAVNGQVVDFEPFLREQPTWRGAGGPPPFVRG